MNIFHTADWHFNEKDHDEIKKCVDFIVDRAEAEKPDLIVISGDITNSRYLNLDTRSARSIFNIINRMLNIAPVAIVLGTPSHDGKIALALRECRGKYPVLVSEYPEQYIYTHDDLWIEENETLEPDLDRAKFLISQLPQPTKQFFVTHMNIEDSETAISQAMTSILAGFGELPEQLQGVPHIVNGHFQVGGAFISETQQLIGRDIELSTSQLALLNADLICLGHIHKSQKIGQNAFYSGDPTAMNFGETENKGFYTHEIKTGEAVFSRFIQTPARKMLEIKEDFTGKDGIENLEMVLHSYGPDALQGSMLKITFTVWQEEARAINQEEIKRSFLDAGCIDVKLHLIRRPRDTVRAEKVLAAETLPDKLVAMAELRGETLSASLLDKAASLESGKEEPWRVI